MSPSSFVAVVVLASVAAPLPEAPPVLRWKLEKGMTFYAEQTTETRQVMKVQGQEITQHQDQTYFHSWTVVKEDSAGWVLRHRIENIKMVIDIGGNKITYDGTKPQNGGEPLNDFFKTLLGSEFTVHVDRTMKITRVEGGEEFIKKLDQANPQMKPLLEQMLHQDGLKEMVNPAFDALPPRAMAKGESWVKHCRMEMGGIGRYEISHEYTFAGKDTQFATFKVDNISFKYVPPTSNTPGLPFTISQADLKGKKGTGTILFNLDRSRVERSEMVFDIEGSMTVDIGGQSTTVELQQTQKSTLRISDKDPLKK